MPVHITRCLCPCMHEVVNRNTYPNNGLKQYLHSLQAMKPYESAAVPESERIEQGAEELEARFRWAPRQLPGCALLCCHFCAMLG